MYPSNCKETNGDMVSLQLQIISYLSQALDLDFEGRFRVRFDDVADLRPSVLHFSFSLQQHNNGSLIERSSDRPKKKISFK
jgi:hypothetical protein